MMSLLLTWIAIHAVGKAGASVSIRHDVIACGLKRS